MGAGIRLVVWLALLAASAGYYVDTRAALKACTAFDGCPQPLSEIQGTGCDVREVREPDRAVSRWRVYVWADFEHGQRWRKLQAIEADRRAARCTSATPG